MDIGRSRCQVGIGQLAVRTIPSSICNKATPGEIVGDFQDNFHG